MSEAQYIQRLPEKALDALYDSLSVQTMPGGRYDGRVWIYGHPVLGWLASLVWRGKVFYQEPALCFHPSHDSRRRVTNRVLKRELFEGRAESVGVELTIDYPRLGLTDTVRQVSPTLYLGRMQWRSTVVHFTLEKSNGR